MESPEKTPPEHVRQFRERHGLEQKALERLFGFTSKGRAARRWEKEGAPSYIHILMCYADTFGFELMEKLAVSRETGNGELKECD